MKDNTVTAKQPDEQQTIAGRIKRARERAGLTQIDVAEKLGLGENGQVIFSSIENAKRQLKAHEVLKLATILSVSPGALLGLEEIPDQPVVLWRTATALPHGGGQVKLRREVALFDRATRYARLAEWTNETPSSQLPVHEIDPATVSDEQARSIAAQCAVVLELGPTPASELEQRLERQFGVRLFFEDPEGDSDGSAACTVHPEFGPAILVNGTEPPWRRVFSIAHELFHLVTWRSTVAAWRAIGAETTPSWYSNLEYRANTFANALLLPRASVASSFQQRSRDGRLGPQDAVQMAHFFGVYRDTLAIGLEAQGLISAPHKQEIMKKGSEYESAWLAFSKDKNTTVAGPFTSRYWELVSIAVQRGEISRSKAASLLEVRLAELKLPLCDAPNAEAATPLRGR